MGGGSLTAYVATDVSQSQNVVDAEYVEYYDDYGEPETKLPDYPQAGKRDRRQLNNFDSVDDVKMFEAVGGAVQTNKTWMYDGTSWTGTAEMKFPRDRPGCSIVNMPDGKVY